jgi:phosphohistidine phosphatase
MIVLVRHGIAEDFNGKGDSFRALTIKGIAKLESTTAPFLAEIGGDFKLFVSPYVRARQTAEVLKRFRGFSDEVILDCLTPDADYKEAANQLEDNVVVVSHLPLLPYLASYILTGSPHGVSIDFGKGSALGISGKVLRFFLNP